MSEQIAHAAISRMNGREQLIDPSYTGLAQDLQRLSTVTPEQHERMMLEQRDELCSAYGIGGSSDRSKPFAFANGVAVVPVHGTLINRFGGSYSFLTGYNAIRAQHNAALLDADVKMIVHDHNSYGGEAAGCFELAADIADSRGAKPIIAVVDSNCYSASFALASAADKIVVTPSAGVGSIGVVAMHVSYAGAMDKMGIKVTFIHSGDHKVDGNPYADLSPAVKADIQKGVDKSRAKFVSLVAQNLGLDEKVVYDTEARTYRAEDAKQLGLIHAIAAPSKALQAALDGEDDGKKAKVTADTPSTPKENTMATPEEQKAAAPVVDVAAVQKAERERCSAIMSCEEAKGKGALATHLAMNTSMSVDDAKATLKAGAAEVADEPEKKEAAKGGTGFDEAMGKAKEAKLGPEGGKGTGEMSMLDQILADNAAATGQSYTQ